MSLMALALLAELVLLGAGSDPAMKEAFAYSRDTLSGVPDMAGHTPGRVMETAYFIYVVLPKGSAPTAANVWIKGKDYTATLQKVVAPVLVEHDPVVPTGEKDTLVPATSSDVYQVLPSGEKSGNLRDEADRQLLQDNEVVVFIQSAGSIWRFSVKTVKPLEPASGQ